jgi:surface polysaccharide O-acyltransferase-like enzyme
MNRQYGALSGVAIALIVLNHAIHYAFQVSPVEGASRNVLIALQALGTFAVPAFLFVSGAFMSYSSARFSLAFLRTNVERIVWPYLIWSVLFYLVLLVTTGERYSAPGYVKNLLVGYPYHFVPLLLFWYVTAPLTARIGRRYGWWLLVAIGLFQGLLVVERFPQIFGDIAPDWARLLRVPILFGTLSDWAIYFPMGLVLRMHEAAVKAWLVRLRLVTLGATVALFALGLLNGIGVVAAPWARFLSPLPLMLLLPVISRDSIPLVRRFELLGKRSYGIYLAHFVFINIAAFLAGSMSVSRVGGMWLVIVPAFFLTALGMALLLMDVMTRVQPARTLYRYVFGIAPPAPERSVSRPPLRAEVAVAVKD